MIFASIAALILLTAEAGRFVASQVGLGAARGHGFGVHLAAGAVALHLLLLACTLSGLSWDWLAPLVPAGLVIVALSRPLAVEPRQGSAAMTPAVAERETRDHSEYCARSPAAVRPALAALG